MGTVRPTRGWLARSRAAFAGLPLWATLVGCAAILVWRKTDLVVNPQFWAEDSVIFFEQAYNEGWSVLWKHYAGYLHTMPRLVAGVAASVDLVYAPGIFVGVAWAGTLYVAARTQSERVGLPRHPAFAFAVVLVPDTFEVLLFLVNAQWVLAGALLLLLISKDPVRARSWGHDLAALVLLGLTGPFVILFAPLFLVRAWQRRTRASTILGALAVALAGIQLAVFILNPVPTLGEKIEPVAALAVPGMRIGASLAIGSLSMLQFEWGAATALSVVTVAVVAWLAARPGGDRGERILLALACAFLLASTLWRCRYVLPPLRTIGFGARYFFPQQLIVLWLLMAAAWDTRKWVARGAVVVALWVVAVNVPRMREPKLDDLKWVEHARRARAEAEAKIPVHPGWTMTLRRAQ